MSKTRWIAGLAMGLGVVAAAAWFVSGAFPLAAAPQAANDAAGVTVDVGASALLHRAPVSYPEAARRRGVEGTVMVEATVDGSGNVSDARVLSGPDELRKAALQSVLQWHFKGAAPGTTRTVSIAFQLPAAREQQAQGPYQDFIVPYPAPERKRITPAMQAKLAEAQAQPPNVEQYIGQLRSPARPATRTLKSIVVVGLSDRMREELLSRLPVHEGDIIADESHGKIVAAVKEFDEHLIVSSTWLSPDDGMLVISAPQGEAPRSGSPPAYVAPVAGATSINTSGPVLIRQSRPVYPLEAKAARISGTVRLSAVISAEGTVRKLEVISGPPLLAPAAIDAVRQWVYQPTLMNGNPVEVATEISVNFTLAQ